MSDLVCEVVELDGVAPVQFFDFQQQVLFSPKERGEGFIKFAISTGKRGAKSVAHAHPRDEVSFTIRGEAILRAANREYHLREGSAVRVPPGLHHTVEVVSEEWVVIAAYCDECSLCRADIKIPAMAITEDQDAANI
ncbi:cupin domain-containing protein [Tianweitania sediminis]|uniref:Cupin domain-containing protein n=1 Tax=Tianweitania sediminis TaxID=1502156 RepID=A0A8J7RQ52_9HYPH|nr:cupin domain-containing protein [Tianweitania sediminis]